MKERKTDTFRLTVANAIQNMITPRRHGPENGVRYWQDKILLIILLLSIVFGFFAYWPSVWLSIKEGLWNIAVADTVIYGWVIVLFFRRTLTYRVRAFSIIALCYLLGIVLFVTIGPFGAGPVWLFFFPVITALLSKEKYAYLALLANAVFMVVLGLVIAFDLYSWGLEIIHPIERWVVIGLNFMLLNVISTVAITTILKGLQTALEHEQAITVSLELHHSELLESNQKLKSEIAEREHVEQSLLESEEKYRTLVSRMNEGVFILDQDYRIVFGNTKLLEIADYSEEELLNQSYERLFSGKHLETMKRLIDESENKFSETEEVYLTRKNGGDIPLLVSGSPVFRSGGFWEIIIVLTDIARMKTAEQKLKDYQEHLEEKIKIRTSDLETAKIEAESANKAKSEFLANISHELRTPMHQILNYSKFGLNKIDKVGNEKLLHYFGQIHSTGDRLMFLLKDLLNLSKLESGRTEIEMRKSDIHRTLTDVLRLFKSNLIEKKLSLEVRNNEQVDTTLLCDQLKLAQVFQNLISNAIQFSPPGKSIVVNLSKDTISMNGIESSALRVSVIDEGVGIPEKEIGLVFEKFVQSSKTKNGAGGTGLGLSICKQIIDLHNGIIWLENNPGGGTIVHFKIPFHHS